MSNFVVNIKSSEKNKTKWQNILSTFKSANINCSRLNETNLGFKAFMAKESDVEALFSVVTKKKLEVLNCIPLKPNYLPSNRSVIVKNVDRYIMELSVDELMTEINESNDYLKVNSVFKFPSGKTLKFECESAKWLKVVLSVDYFC